MMLAKTLIGLALPALATLPALADPIASQNAFRHIGQTASVTGRASLTFMPSGEVYIDLDGRGEDAPFAGYISRWNRIRFQDLSALVGKRIEISGQIATFRGQPEIFLQDHGQITTKQPHRHVLAQTEELRRHYLWLAEMQHELAQARALVLKLQEQPGQA